MPLYGHCKCRYPALHHLQCSVPYRCESAARHTGGACKLPNVNAVKEASGNISQVADVAALCGEELNIYSGNDDQIVPILSLGGKGVISVLSNVAPQQAHDICAAWFSGDTAKSLELQLKALPLCHALFADVNPIPVKWAMNRLGWNAGPLRLPLVEPSAAVQQSLENEMKAYGVLK